MVKNALKQIISALISIAIIFYILLQLMLSVGETVETENAVMQQGVELRNALYTKANNPTEPHNPSLVRKYYAALRQEMVDSYGELFEKLSQINQ